MGDAGEKYTRPRMGIMDEDQKQLMHSVHEGGRESIHEWQ